MLLEGRLIDELRTKIYFESSLQEERNIIEKESESKIAEFVLDVRGVI